MHDVHLRGVRRLICTSFILDSKANNTSELRKAVKKLVGPSSLLFRAVYVSEEELRQRLERTGRVKWDWA